MIMKIHLREGFYGMLQQNFTYKYIFYIYENLRIMFDLIVCIHILCSKLCRFLYSKFKQLLPDYKSLYNTKY